MTKRCEARRPSESAPTLTAASFVGLGIGSDGSAPMVRHAPPPAGSSYESKRKMAREDERKVWHDMQRHVNFLVDKAIARKSEEASIWSTAPLIRAHLSQVTLPFRVSDFVRLREGGGVKVEGPGALPELGGRVTRLRAADGPAVVADLDDVPAFWYFPGFIGKGLRVTFLTSTELLQRVAELARVYRPKPDKLIKDRRVQAQAAGVKLDHGTSSCGILTRSQTAKLADSNDRERDGRAVVDEPEDHDQGAVSDEADDDSSSVSLDEADGESSFVSLETNGESPSADPVPIPYEETDGEVRWKIPVDDDVQHPELPDPVEVIGEEDDLDYLSKLDSFAYYFSPAWYPTGMEYVRPISMSSHFQEALEPASSSQTIRLLEAKRLYDGK
ncbi:hypothetical protein FRC10_007836, partial [Ceratobasidium sp. 414]